MGAVLSLFYGECSYVYDVGVFLADFWTGAVIGFEEDEQREEIWLWEGWNGDRPVVVQNDSLCGRSSLYLREGRSLVFNLNSGSSNEYVLPIKVFCVCHFV